MIGRAPHAEPGIGCTMLGPCATAMFLLHSFALPAIAHDSQQTTFLLGLALAPGPALPYECMLGGRSCCQQSLPNQHTGTHATMCHTADDPLCTLCSWPAELHACRATSALPPASYLKGPGSLPQSKYATFLARLSCGSCSLAACPIFPTTCDS